MTSRGRPGRGRAGRLACARRLALGVVVLLLGACQPDSDGGEGVPGVPAGSAQGRSGEPLLALVAASVSPAMDELVALHEARTGLAVTPVYGASGSLAAQLRNGAPADLFFSADEGFLDALIADGAVAPETRTVYAIGRLALVVPPGAALPEGIASLASPEYRVVAIANPDHAPYGVAAREVLEAVGVLEDVGPRLVYGENVAQTLQFVRTGNAEAGLVALSLLSGRAVDEVPPHREVDVALHRPLAQAAGVAAASARPAEARAFLAFVRSAEGQAVLARHGFGTPDP